jgi:hypothetical protein
MADVAAAILVSISWRIILLRANPFRKHKRFVLVRISLVSDRIWVSVRPATLSGVTHLSDAGNFGQHWPFEHYISKFETMEELEV